MNRKVSRIIGVIMLIAAIVFVAVALTHPEMSFPFGNQITYLLYALYAVITVLLLAAPFGRKKK